MSKQIYRVRNWKEYNRNLINRGSITFWFSEEVVKNWYYEGKRKRGGIIKYSDMAIICVLTLRNLFRMPLRAAQGLVESLIGLIKLDVDAPNYSTLSRRASGLKIGFPKPCGDEPLHVVIDSTGINVYGESEWKSVKHGTCRYQVWRKLHIIMDIEKQIILAADCSESSMHDANYLPSLVEGIDGEIDCITGDGAYDKKKCYRAAHKKGAKLIAPPQHDAIVQRNKYKKDPALLARDQVIKDIKDLGGNEAAVKEWKEKNGYHNRSLVETAMFRLKTVFGEEVRSRKFANQKTELLIRCVALNKMTALGLPKSEMIPM